MRHHILVWSRGAFQKTFWLIQFGLTRLVVVLYIQVRPGFFYLNSGEGRDGLGIPLSPINYATITKIPSSTMQKSKSLQ